MICKKAKQILAERKKAEEDKQKVEQELKEEVLIASEEKICPYCGEQTEGISSFWSEGITYRCAKCKILFSYQQGYEYKSNFRIEKEDIK